MKKKNEEDFYMVLPSNSCPSTQPDNVANKYIVDWETAIKLEGKWKVALSEFSIIPQLGVIDKDLQISYSTNETIKEKITVIYQGPNKPLLIDGARKIMFLRPDGKLEAICEFTPWKLIFPSQAVAKLYGYNEMENISMDKSIVANTKPVANNPLINEIVEISYVDSLRVHVINIQENLLYESYEQITEYLLKKCSKIFDHVSIDVNERIYIRTKKDVTKVIFSRYISDILGLQDESFRNVNDIRGYRNPRLLSKSIQFFIYSSIVNPIHVGGVLVPLLKSIGIENVYLKGEAVIEAMDHLMYIPISCTTINNIEINIRNDSGELIHFPKGLKSSLTLHFQKYE
jgi:hypothetical protein